VATPDNHKELTRKLFWAVTSTCKLTRQQRSSTFTWAADLAEKILTRTETEQKDTGKPLPSASRLDPGPKDRYAALAEGRGGGRVPSSLHSTEGGVRHTPSLPFLTTQAGLKSRALAYLSTQPWVTERTNGRVDSPGAAGSP